MIDGTRVSELLQLTVEEGGVRVGASVTLTRMGAFLRKVATERPTEVTDHCWVARLRMITLEPLLHRRA